MNAPLVPRQDRPNGFVGRRRPTGPTSPTTLVLTNVTATDLIFKMERGTESTRKLSQFINKHGHSWKCGTSEKNGLSCIKEVFSRKIHSPSPTVTDGRLEQRALLLSVTVTRTQPRMLSSYWKL